MAKFDSILAVDFGNVHTRALLIDLVEGVYRLVATSAEHTTAGFPFGDVGAGLKRALDQLTYITGRRFYDGNGTLLTQEQSDRSGVDLIVATASIGRPLRTVLMGLVPNVSIASGLRASSGTYIQIVETISLDDPRPEEEQINAIVLSRPDLIFITGGTEDGAAEPVVQMARLAQLAAMLMMRSQRRPTILYAGNSALTDIMRTLFSGMNLLIAPNVRPSLDEEQLEPAQLQLGMAFDASTAQRGMGFDTVGRYSRLGVMPTAQSYNLILDYLGQALDGGVLAVDVGSAASILSGSDGGRVTTTIRTDIGVGHSARALLDAVGMDAVRAWLPMPVSDEEIVAYTLNKTLRPATVPETLTDLYLEYALLRAGIRALARATAPAWNKAAADSREIRLPSFARIIGAGAALTQTGRPGLSAMLLLDAVQPEGVTTLQADPFALIPALGALAHLNPAAVVQVLDGSSLERLGICFNVSGTPRPGKTALKIRITPVGTRDAERYEVEGGHLLVYPLPASSRVQVDVQVSGGGLSIGGKSRVRMEVIGGTAGLIFDARGRPLPLATTPAGLAAQLPLWLAEATGDAVREIEFDEDEFTDEDLSPKERRRREKAAKAEAAKAAKAAKQAEKAAKKQKPPKEDKKARGKQKEEAALPQGEGDDLDELRNLLS